MLKDHTKVQPLEIDLGSFLEQYCLVLELGEGGLID